ncbi:MAG: phage portal protein [Limosilactobacillus mucosae]|nr:phage portal protein [Limosilactobacillus mucosae]
MQTMAINDNAFITKEGVYLFDGDELLTDSLMAFINNNRQRSTEYVKNYDLYSGQHELLRKPFDRRSMRPDNRVISNWANYVVDTYVGYFIGKPPKIALDDDSKNELLQDWLSVNSFQDKLSEVAKQVAIYGRSYMMAYQNENSQTEIAVCSPDESFIVYDTTIKRKPVAFVRYSVYGNNLSGDVYTANEIKHFGNDGKIQSVENHLFSGVPAAEFVANDERLSLVGKIATLVNEYDRAISQKANQVAYFDNAYLKILGVPLPKDENGKPILDLVNNRVFYAPNENAANGVVDFISKPDGDTMQENMLNRLKDDIFQTAMVANLNDEAFSGNASGVAIRYKLLSMQNQAAFEDRKFSISLRELLGTALSIGSAIGTIDREAVMKQLQIVPARNIPLDIENEAQTASILSGVVSKETQLSTLSIVDDPKKEIERMHEEQTDDVKNAMQSIPSMTDQDKADQEQEVDVDE